MDKTTYEVMKKFVPDLDGLLVMTPVAENMVKNEGVNADAIDVIRQSIDAIKWGKADVQDLRVVNYHHGGSMGESIIAEVAYVFRGEQWESLDVRTEYTDKDNASDHQDTYRAGEPVGDCLQDGDQCVAVYRWDFDDWPGRDMIRERTITLYEVDSPLTPQERLLRWARQIIKEAESGLRVERSAPAGHLKLF